MNHNGHENRMKTILLGATLCLFAFAANAAENQPVKATYGLFTGGVRMIEVQALFDLQPKSYDVRTDAKTIGIFQKMLPWKGTFETTGTDAYKPLKHDYTVKWRGDVQTGTFIYEPAGVFKSMTRTENDEDRTEPLAADITDGTKDLLSALMTAVQNYEKNKTCEGDVLTFDNSRSFIVRFKDAGDGLLNNPKLSTYTGPAHACTVEIIPQKGKWPKKPRGWLRIQQQAKEGNQLPTIWLAKPKPELPVIPVRVDIHTKYGDVFAHLTKVQ
jgi:hypothetical protein